jgi:hypothetical protein
MNTYHCQFCQTEFDSKFKLKVNTATCVRCIIDLLRDVSVAFVSARTNVFMLEGD